MLKSQVKEPFPEEKVAVLFLLHLSSLVLTAPGSLILPLSFSSFLEQGCR